MTNEKIENMGEDIDKTTGNFIVQQETVSSPNESVQAKPKLPGGPIPDHMLWETRVLQDVKSKTTKEAGARIPEGDYYSFNHGETLSQIMDSNGKRKPFIKLQSGQDVSFNAWKLARRDELAAVLENVDQDYNAAYLCAVEDFPHLDQMQVESGLPEDHPTLDYTGGFYRRPTDSNEPPKIIVNMEQNQHYDKLLFEREESARKSAEEIGIDFETMRQNPDILKLFIFLHEIGHAEDYITNFQKNRLNEHDPAGANLEKRKKEMNTLPIPGTNPVQARKMYDKGELQQYFLEYRQHYGGKGINSAEELLKANEIAYHELPSERYADKFAAKVLKKHWRTLIKQESK